jgi:hypothetical protein
MVLVSSSGFEDWNIYSEDNFTLAMNSLAWLADPGYSDVPWLSVEPVSGTIAGHDSGEVAIRFDASGLNPGVYYAALAMENNDPAQPNPFLVPVTMTVVAVEPLVALEPEAQVASGEPGSVVTYTLSVYNVGNIADSYTLTAAGTWTATLPVTGTGILEPGEDTRIVFSVSIPADAADGSSDTTTVTAESTYPGVSATAEATTTAMVAAEPLVTLEPETQSASGEPGSVVTYTLTVQNMGNVADSYTLAVSGTWTATLQVTQTGTLAPGEEYPMILSVTILADAVDGSSDTAMVTAESTYPGVSATAEVVTTAIVPEWEVFLPEVISGFTP